VSAFEILGKVDRRWIFLFIALAVIVPLLAKLKPPTKTTPIVQRIFDKVEALEPDSKILVTADYGPSTVPENQPMLEAVCRHLFHLGHQVYAITLWATGPPMLDNMVANVVDVDFPNLVYGADYVNFGYKAGNQGVINGAYTNFKDTFPVDARGSEVSTIPMMADVNRLEDFDLIVAIGSGFPGVKEWIQFGGDRARVPVAGGVTAVEAPLLYPYYPQQLLGLMGGLQGAAEYEAALVEKYPEYTDSSTQAIQRMGPQTVAHLVIILFIVLGNLSYLLSRRQRGKP
jgi:hypothetical protein